MQPLPREFFEQLSRDLLGVDCYWLMASEGHEDDYRICDGGGCCGATGRSYDLTWRPVLEAGNRWHGRAPAIFLHDERLIEEANTLAAEFNYPVEKLRIEAQTSVAIHELAHVAENGIDLAEPTPERDLFALQVVAYSACITLDDASPYPSWFGHDWKFIRLALHLAYRASLMGYQISADLLFPFGAYQLPRGFAFLMNLDNEPAELLDVSPFDLASIEPPAKFISYWRYAMSQWRETNPPAAQIAWAEQRNYLEKELCPS